MKTCTTEVPEVVAQVVVAPAESCSVTSDGQWNPSRTVTVEEEEEEAVDAEKVPNVVIACHGRPWSRSRANK